MGRRPYQTGHVQGQFPLRRVAPNDQRGLPSPPTPYDSPPASARHATSLQSWQAVAGPSSSRFSWADTRQTPSTTDAMSPVSTNSTFSNPSVVTAASSDYTAILGDARHLSPDADTPMSSTASMRIQYPALNTSGPAQNSLQASSNRSMHSPDQDHSMTEAVLGIDERVLPQEAIYYLHPPQFIPRKGPSPQNHQRYPTISEPWSAYRFRHEDEFISMDSDPPVAMDLDQEQAQMPGGRVKGGRRIGPLTEVQREQANGVRRIGACLRCIIMREKCDLQSPCHNCSTKDRRKFPKHCIRNHFDWDLCKSNFFPDEWTVSHQQKKLFEYLSDSSFTLFPKDSFKMTLDMNIGIPLIVTVTEFIPLQTAGEIRRAFVPVQDAYGKKSFEKRRHWSPPVIMCIRDGDMDRQVQLMRQKVREIFEQVLDDPKKWENWTIQYFTEKEEDFQTDILRLMGKYYRKKIQEHWILKIALSLLWFEYLLVTKFRVPASAVPDLEANMAQPRPASAQQGIDVIPVTINRFIKAIVLRVAQDAAKKVTKVLHEMLFKMATNPTRSKSRADLVLCMTFVLMIFLGRTQSILFLIADCAPDEPDFFEYTFEDAEAKIQEMEDSVCEYLLSFHKYTLGRRSSSSRSVAGDPEASSPAEVHAKEFDLVGQLCRAVEADYGKLPASSGTVGLQADEGVADEKPRNFDVGLLERGSFRFMNVRRLCWKVLLNIEQEPRCGI